MMHSWTIKLDVADLWLTDGFNPDADQLEDAIRSTLLGYASEHEVKVTIIEKPSEQVIEHLQGYNRKHCRECGNQVECSGCQE